MRSVTARTLVLAAASLLAPVGAAWAQDDARDTMVDAGESFFMEYCASCHGRDAKGDGPMAAYLTEEPADLTGIAARRDGAFPAGEIAKIIRGDREVKGHGSREMPIWGRRFRETGGTMAQSGPAVRARVQFLVEYLRSIQRSGDE